MIYSVKTNKNISWLKFLWPFLTVAEDSLQCTYVPMNQHPQYNSPIILIESEGGYNIEQVEGLSNLLKDCNYLTPYQAKRLTYTNPSSLKELAKASVLLHLTNRSLAKQELEEERILDFLKFPYHEALELFETNLKPESACEILLNIIELFYSKDKNIEVWRFNYYRPFMIRFKLKDFKNNFSFSPKEDYKTDLANLLTYFY